MVISNYWADSYIEKRRSLSEAMRLIKSGQRVFVGSSSGEPQHLLKGLADSDVYFSDIEIVRLLSMESVSLTSIADKTRDQKLNIRSFYLGSARLEELAQNKRFLTPTNLSARKAVLFQAWRAQPSSFHVAMFITW